jgi:hypothetical protein
LGEARRHLVAVFIVRVSLSTSGRNDLAKESKNVRDFFILALEKLVAVIVVIMMIAVVIGAFAAGSEQGAGVALGILVGGGLYVILMGGMLYLFLGIYHNTKRTAELLANQK